MKQLNCSSCGAPINVDESKGYGKCPYCGAKYKLNEDINVNIKLDDDLKNIVNNGIETAKKGSKMMLIPFLLIFIGVSIVFVIVIPKTLNDAKKRSDEQQEEFDVSSFNSKYEIKAGKKPKMFAETVIDDIALDNKKTNHKITLVYNDKEYTDSKEITNIKNELTKSEYEITLDYDKKGYINKITIE